MQKRLDNMGIKYLTLTGKTNPTERIELVNEFNNNSDIKVFLISLKAGGTGLNLTSADTVIHYDPWWNIAAMNQATDRAHRLGQKNKKFLSDEVINDNDVMMKLSKDDIKELFR